jgi:uncharacterized Fe-S center protein
VHRPPVAGKRRFDVLPFRPQRRPQALRLAPDELLPDCDGRGAKPTCGDIGILGSRDILATDKASVDLVYARPEQERRDIVERIESRTWLNQLEYIKALQMGNDQYELIRV